MKDFSDKLVNLHKSKFQQINYSAFLEEETELPNIEFGKIYYYVDNRMNSKTKVKCLIELFIITEMDLIQNNNFFCWTRVLMY